MKTKEEIASEWVGLKLELFTNTTSLEHIHPYITPKQCLRAMEAYAAQKDALIKAQEEYIKLIEDEEYQFFLTQTQWTTIFELKKRISELKKEK